MSAKFVRYCIENGQLVKVASVERLKKLDQDLATQRENLERPAGWEKRVLIPSTHFLHLRHEIKLMKENSPILYHGKRLTFEMVAACCSLHPSTVSHWYQLTQKRRLSTELLVLLQFYGGTSLNDALCWQLPDRYYWDTEE